MARSLYPPGLPQREELRHASSRLASIEINATFHGPQKPESFRRWHDQVPEDFVFALKAPRALTHRRRLAETGAGIVRFLDSGPALLGDKLGPITWQFPATTTFDPEDFAAFLALLPSHLQGRPLRHAVELRHASFRSPALVALLRRHRVAAVILGDSPYPQIADPTADFAYLRLMGSRAAPAAGYPPGLLDLWARRARALADGRSVDLEMVTPDPAPVPRDVFLYVIGGAKENNPQAAMALAARVEG